MRTSSQHAQCLRTCFRPVLALVQPNRFGNLLADGKDRVQRRHRLLKDHGQIRAAQLAHGGFAGLRQIQHTAVAPMEMHLAADDAPATMLNQPHDGQRRDRFA